MNRTTCSCSAAVPLKSDCAPCGKLDKFMELKVPDRLVDLCNELPPIVDYFIWQGFGHMPMVQVEMKMVQIPMSLLCQVPCLQAHFRSGYWAVKMTSKAAFNTPISFSVRGRKGWN